MLEPVSDLEIAAIENGAAFNDPTAVTNKPHTGMLFLPRNNIDDRAMAGHLYPGDYGAFWLQQHILSNVPAHSAVVGSLAFSWY